MTGVNIEAFFIGVCTAYFATYAYHIFIQPSRTRYQSLLGWIFIAWAGFNLKDLVLIFPHMYHEETLNWITLIDGTMAVTYTLFLFELTMPGWATLRRALLLLIPFAAFIALYAVWRQPTIVTAYYAFVTAYALTILAFGYIKARRYLRYAKDNFSNIDTIDISWLRHAFWFFIVSQLAWLYSAVMNTVLTDCLYYASSIVLWQVLLQHSYHITPIILPPAEPQDSTACREHGTRAENGEELRKQRFDKELKVSMESAKIYLNPHLTLAQLAASINTNRTYLSDYFSQQGVTFYDYINQQRIKKESIPLIENHPEYTLEYIAHESGFKSVSTFRRAFQKITGLSPGAYRNQLKAQKD